MSDRNDIAARKLIDHLVPDPRWGTIRSLVATTYELQPEFVETDYLPSLFGLGAWDDRSWSSRIALERRLAEMESATILVEPRRYRGRPRSLRLEVLPAVVHAGASLHAKVTLVVADGAVRLVVGSANLSEPGYRRNREGVAVLTVTPARGQEASLVFEALAGMEQHLGPALSPGARSSLEGARAQLVEWGFVPTNAGMARHSVAPPRTGRQEEGHSDGKASHATFAWSGGPVRLWKEFFPRWPAGEALQSITIVSPFWSEDAAGTLEEFLIRMRERAGASQETHVRLLTSAVPLERGRFVPVLPPAFKAHDWKRCGCRVTVQAVDPSVLPEEVGGMDEFGGLRDLHAKLVMVNGLKTTLTYLGSANFTARGWGFLPEGRMANIEAGLIVLETAGGPFGAGLEPPVWGEPIALDGTGSGVIAVPPAGIEPAPWPHFISEVRLRPVEGTRDRLRLVFTLVPPCPAGGWTARLPGKDGLPEIMLVAETEPDSAASSHALPLETDVLNRILVEQQVCIAWPECPAGAAVPVNVDAEARVSLPVAPGQGPLQENQLLAYYQGRIAWVDLFPEDGTGGDGGRTTTPSGLESGVDKSRIQSYQVREFVGALEGVRRDLRSCVQSEGAIRLALLGPVSPVALARTVMEAVKQGSRPRSPVAAGFQLVELLVCLGKAHENEVPERLRSIWETLLGEAEHQLGGLLAELEATFPQELGTSTSFQRYHRAVGRVSRRGAS